ncbi:MAG: hypothetical protein OJF50_000957 [Nitrospira sp.]|jgi:hypothetical protein|nr:hypothetical protein [Nitrospira sp.]
MLGLLKTADEIIAVNDRLLVQECKQSLDEARARFIKAESDLNEIAKKLAPITSSSSFPGEQVDEIVRIRAEGALGQASQTFLETKAVLKSAERKFQTVIEAESRLVTSERIDGRRELVSKLFERLDEAVAVAEEIRAYDLETQGLGGTPPLPAVGELLSHPYRQSIVEANRFALKKDGWL